MEGQNLLSPLEYIAESLPEVLRLILDKLDDRERCSHIPLVCKTLLTAYRLLPAPQRRQWVIAKEPVSRNMVQWLRRIKDSLEVLSVQGSGADHLPQLLMTAVHAPRLQHLQIIGQVMDDNDVSSMAFGHALNSATYIGQLRVLSLQRWLFPNRTPDHDRGHHVHQLSLLTALEVLDFQILNVEEVTASKSVALFAALARLPRLASVAMEATQEEGEPQALFTFLRHASKLVQISALTFKRADSFGIPNNQHVLDSFGSLTQLTSLSVNSFFLAHSYSPMMQLRGLQSLCMVMDVEAGNEAVIHFHLPEGLTRLVVRGSRAAEPVGVVHLPHFSGLHGLRELTLRSMWIEELPDLPEDSLQQLTYLNLRGNELPRLPFALAQITALRELDVRDNPLLQLQEDDVQTLAPLHQLRKLTLAKRPQHFWNAASEQVIAMVAMQMTYLELVLELPDHELAG